MKNRDGTVTCLGCLLLFVAALLILLGVSLWLTVLLGGLR